MNSHSAGEPVSGETGVPVSTNPLMSEQAGNGGGGPSGDALLLESGDYLLLESGDYLLLE